LWEPVEKDITIHSNFYYMPEFSGRFSIIGELSGSNQNMPEYTGRRQNILDDSGTFYSRPE
jgi:hypothetical protein